MNIQAISQAEFNKIEGVRHIIVHDCSHQFAILDLGEQLEHYGLSWRSSHIIQPVTTLSKDGRTLWVGVDQRLAAIDLQDGHICLSISLHTPLFQILALDDSIVVLTELDVLLFNNSDRSIRCLEGLPEIAADMTVNRSDLVIRLIDENRLILNLDTLELKEQSPVYS
ncbi:hypothetical protein [Argonema antarcticum]|uniref:hypothetical protein n=1 Tax=Argonema antarcticum TaxID=2942763 RepID=UPI0020118BCA|nr:hypothetical protein [Argonema antarcticum]MCL1472445.1 hypothetical protein [Argonema antarcticum A004/B2]